MENYCVTHRVGETVDGIVLTATQYNYTIPMMIFTLLSILALGVSLLLKAEDKKKGYGLQLPNIKK